MTTNRKVFINKSYRFLAWMFVVSALVAAGFVALSPETPWWSPMVATPIAGGWAYLGWKVYGSSQVTIEGQQLIVTNPFKAHVLLRGDLEAVEAGRYLILHTKAGDVIKVWSIQAANISLMLGKESHVDRVAAEIRQWRSGSGDEAAPSPSPR